MPEKGPLFNLRTTQVQTTLREWADQGLRCPLIESMDTVVYVDVQLMPRSDCVNAQAD